MTERSQPVGMRCSAWARANRLDPVGSAGCYRGFLLVEVPLPWPRDVAEIPDVAALAPVLAGAGLRVQALVPRSESERRVIAYLAPGGPFSGFERSESTFDGDLTAAVASLLAGASARAGPAPTAGAIRDLLVCTHGRRDVCCGSRGTDLAAKLAGDGLPDGVRLWRTSHTGGHRFAPTFVVLPEGTLWAFADADLVRQVLGRSGDAAGAGGRYRGCAGLARPEVQALEREVLRRVGWGLLDRPRAGAGAGGGHFELHVDAADVWEGLVTPGRLMPVPDCGQPIEAARKHEHEWDVRDVSVRRSATMGGDGEPVGWSRPGIDPVEEGRDSAGQGAG